MLQELRWHFNLLTLVAVLTAGAFAPAFCRAPGRHLQPVATASLRCSIRIGGVCTRNTISTLQYLSSTTALRSIAQTVASWADAMLRQPRIRSCHRLLTASLQKEFGR